VPDAKMMSINIRNPHAPSVTSMNGHVRPFWNRISRMNDPENTSDHGILTSIPFFASASFFPMMYPVPMMMSAIETICMMVSIFPPVKCAVFEKSTCVMHSIIEEKNQ